jgi:hypothetical protein
MPNITRPPAVVLSLIEQGDLALEIVGGHEQRVPTQRPGALK